MAGNLPHQLTSFVGRSQEIGDVRRALHGARLLTLTGAGGCGKSRLAVEVAGSAQERGAGGRWMVDLGPLSHQEQVEAALVRSLGIRPLPGQSGLTAAAAQLATRDALVVFDNCEHLLEATAATVESLLRACPRVTVLATSRTALGVVGETLWRVPSLSLPAPSVCEPREALVKSDAVSLFCERARAVQTDFELTAENLPAITSTCRAVDGIALAIELAAARTRLMTPGEVASGLSDCLRFLVGGPRGAPPRQQTLRASVEWSHDLLDEAERTLLRRLAIFDGGWTLRLAEDVANGQDRSGRELLDLLGSLADDSLVVVEHAEPATRYRLLASVRAYGLERLAASGEERAMRDRHLDALLALAERAEPHLTGIDQHVWLAELDREHANLTQALDHANRTNSHKALRLAAALTFHYRRSGRFAAADKAFAAALGAAPASAPERARALAGRAYVAAYGGSPAEAVRLAEEALALAEPAGESLTSARSLAVLGYVHQFRSPLEARPRLERSVRLAEQNGDAWCQVFAAHSLAWTYLVQDRADEGLARADAVLPLIERHGYGEFLAKHHLLLGLSALARADWRSFDAHCERGLAAARAVEEPLIEGSIEVFLGWSEILRGHADKAAARAPRARERALRAGAGLVLPGIEYVLGWIDLAQGRAEAALARMDAVIATGVDGGLYLARALVLQAEARQEVGQAQGAVESLGKALGLARRLDSAWIDADARLCQARIGIDDSHWVAAGDHVHCALESVEGRGLVPLVAPALVALAAVAAGLRKDADAARLLGAARRAGDEHEVDPPGHASRVTALERALSERLGARELEDSLGQGEGLAPWEAVAYARRGRKRTRPPASGWTNLTATELEVVRHVVAGLTNPQIAQRMFVTRGTVKTHLSHVYRKLDVRNRSELAAVAARRGASTS